MQEFKREDADGIKPPRVLSRDSPLLLCVSPDGADVGREMLAGEGEVRSDGD
jgi:hypothetical protein